MAEGQSTDNNSWENWLGGWVQTAKEKSSSALEMVKKDLAEFTCTIQKDTERAVELTKESLNNENTTHATNRVKSGLTSFLDNISRVLVIPPDDDYVPVKIAADGSGLYDRGKARLHAIQLDASTYMDPPDGPPEQYSMWLESFNMDEHKGEVSELLVSKVEVRALYTKLVPSEVSHAEFWQRYFYRLHQLQCDEARKQALMKRADQTKGDSFSWDDDDDWSGGEDENEHSDWEKMPRPQQILASATTPAPTKQLVKQNQESSVESAVENSTYKDSEPSVMQKPIVHVKSDSAATVSANKFDGSEAEKLEKNTTEKLLETSVSAFAASSVQSHGDEPKPENRTHIGISPQASQDASDDLLCYPELQVSSVDLWSLHIPNDTASASNSGQDTDCTETGILEPGFPSDICRQVKEIKNISEGSDSCAAGGGDVILSTDDNASEVNMGDGASGTADLDLTRSLQVLEPSPGVSAASIDISDKSNLIQMLDQEVSFPSVGARGEFAHVYEQSSTIMPTLRNKAESQSVSEPASASLVAPIVEDVPAIDKVTLKCEHSVATIVSDDINFSQHVLDDSKVEKTAVPESLKKEPENGTLTPVNVDPNAVDGGEMKEIGMRLKGDMVVVGDRDSPLSSESTDTKEIGLEEDWEQDFDIEVTEEDLKTAENIAKQLGENLNAGDDDWENWE